MGISRIFRRAFGDEQTAAATGPVDTSKTAMGYLKQLVGKSAMSGPFGTEYFVDYATGADTNNGTSPSTPFKTYSTAVAAVTTSKNDIIWVQGGSTVVEASGTMVTMSKNRVHTIGYQGPVANPYGIGARAKISCTATETATNIATMINTGVGNTFTNIKFINANTVAEGLYSVVEAGEYARYLNCEIYKSTDLDVTGASELVCNGDSPSFEACVIGSSANVISGAIIRANVLFTKGIGGAGKVTRDAIFKDCILWRQSSNSANRFVYGANATDIERYCEFDGCKFINTKPSAGTPAQNVAFGASLTVGEVLLNNCVALNAGTAMSTTTGVFIHGYTPDATGAAAGIAIQTA